MPDTVRSFTELKKQIRQADLRNAKSLGFSDRHLAEIWHTDEQVVRKLRKDMGITPVYKTVDTCAAEFAAQTPYFYSTYETESEVPESSKPRIIILGGGPNRIGQGIEFDYCCVHGVMALQELGYEVIMINCNPETVSTDYDMSDRLYFEPLTFEDVMNIIEIEKPTGVVVQFGGQTPLKLALPLLKSGVPIIGTSPESIDMAEDRRKFGALLDKLGIAKPAYGTAVSIAEATRVAEEIGYPVLVRPSYVLGGRAMEIVYDRESLEDYMNKAIDVSPAHPVLVDNFLENAIEIDVDAICDGTDVFIGGVMQHIEEAGVHSGDSTCVLPPYSINAQIMQQLTDHTRRLALELKVIGLLNIQFAVLEGEVYVLEVNPRASRTTPFVSKAIGVPLAKIAAKVMVGKSLKELGYTAQIIPKHYAIKDPVFPFSKFPGARIFLGPEMKSTGEVMGLADRIDEALAKAHIAAGMRLPTSGGVFISVNDRDKAKIIDIALSLIDLGFVIYATTGTGNLLGKNNIEYSQVFKMDEGRPNVVDHIKNKRIDLVINTPTGKEAKVDERYIGNACMLYKVPAVTTIPGARATVKAIESLQENRITVKPTQEYR